MALADVDEAVVVAGVDVRRRLAERQRRQRLRVPNGGGKRSSARLRLPWAALLQRVFGYSVLVCLQCFGPRLVLAAIHDPAAIARVLGALGLPGSAPGQAAYRASPAYEDGGVDG